MRELDKEHIVYCDSCGKRYRIRIYDKEPGEVFQESIEKAVRLIRNTRGRFS